MSRNRFTLIEQYRPADVRLWTNANQQIYTYWAFPSSRFTLIEQIQTVHLHNRAIQISRSALIEVIEEAYLHLLCISQHQIYTYWVNRSSRLTQLGDTEQRIYNQWAVQCKDHLVGLVVKASASRAAGRGFDTGLRLVDFSGSSHTSDSSGYPARRLAL